MFFFANIFFLALLMYARVVVMSNHNNRQLDCEAVPQWGPSEADGFTQKMVQKLRILVTARLHVQALGGRLFLAVMTRPLLLVTRCGRMVRTCLDSLLNQCTLARHDRHPNPD